MMKQPFLLLLKKRLSEWLVPLLGIWAGTAWSMHDVSHSSSFVVTSGLAVDLGLLVPLALALSSWLATRFQTARSRLLSGLTGLALMLTMIFFLSHLAFWDTPLFTWSPGFTTFLIAATLLVVLSPLARSLLKQP